MRTAAVKDMGQLELRLHVASWALHPLCCHGARGPAPYPALPTIVDQLGKQDALQRSKFGRGAVAGGTMAATDARSLSCQSMAAPCTGQPRKCADGLLQPSAKQAAKAPRHAATAALAGNAGARWHSLITTHDGDAELHGDSGASSQRSFLPAHNGEDTIQRRAAWAGSPAAGGRCQPTLTWKHTFRPPR